MKTTQLTSQGADPGISSRADETAACGDNPAALSAQSSAEDPAKSTSLGQKCRRRRHAGYLALFLLFLALLIPLVTVVQMLPPPRPVPSARFGVNGPRHSESFEERVAWYFKSGQWRGDARTVAAMFRYLVSPEPAPAPNQPASRA